MWQNLYPGRPADEVPIGHITNGVHLLGWMKGPVRRFWKRKLGVQPVLAESDSPPGDSTRFWAAKPPPAWEAAVNSLEFWQRMAEPSFISDEEILSLRYKL